jgi:hypothetical protein
MFPPKLRSHTPIAASPPQTHAVQRCNTLRIGTSGISGEITSRGRFATPADSPPHDCSPHSHVHARPRKFGICPSFRGPFSVAHLPKTRALRFAAFRVAVGAFLPEVPRAEHAGDHVDAGVQPRGGLRSALPEQLARDGEPVDAQAQHQARYEVGAAITNLC